MRLHPCEAESISKDWSYFTFTRNLFTFGKIQTKCSINTLTVIKHQILVSDFIQTLSGAQIIKLLFYMVLACPQTFQGNKQRYYSCSFCFDTFNKASKKSCDFKSFFLWECIANELLCVYRLRLLRETKSLPLYFLIHCVGEADMVEPILKMLQMG